MKPVRLVLASALVSLAAAACSDITAPGLPGDPIPGQEPAPALPSDPTPAPSPARMGPPLP